MYYLALDVVSNRAAYLLVYEDTMEASPAGITFIAKAIYAPQLPQDGYRRLRDALRKWWRLDARILVRLHGYRGAAERMAPEVEVFFADFDRCVHATVGVAPLAEIHIGLVDVRPVEGKLMITPLFMKYGSAEVTLERFLRRESQYKEAFFQLLATVRGDVIELADVVARAIHEASRMAGSVVEQVPSAFDVISQVLRRYNVDPRMVIDYAVREAKAEELLRRGAVAPPAAPAARGGRGGGGGGGGT